MITLGIESSCDDTAAAVLDGDDTIRANVVSGQDTIHARFGGVVPELASRRHMEAITVVVDEALRRAALDLRDIDLIAATQGPGLIGSLLVGFSYAKALAFTTGRPFVGVDHMAGHLLSAFLEPVKPSFPYLALIVSGGTTALFRVDDFFTFTLLGRTRDDAAGEAFDKVARLLGIGYPGGPAISRYALQGNAERFVLPRAWLEEGSLDFSFSGLKTAVLNQYRQIGDHRDDRLLADLCASFEQAVVDVLVSKSLLAAEQLAVSSLVLGGGVSANTALRTTLTDRCRAAGLQLYLPAVQHCTDNAAMIAFAGRKWLQQKGPGCWSDDVFSRSQLGQVSQTLR
jgi:N6-L-threonylcarbamoyladenine synthase